jgi:O-antigen/teichoic acid export membrane protein
MELGKRTFANTLRRKLVGGGFWALGGKVFAALSALIVNAILSRFLSPNDFGAYFIVLSIITFTATLGTFGTDLTVVRMVAESMTLKHFRQAKQFTRVVIGLGVVSSLLTVALYLLFHETITLRLYESPILATATLGIALWIGVAVFQRVLAEVFRGFHHIRSSTLISGIGTRGGGILMGLLQPLAVAGLGVLGFATLHNVLLISAAASLIIVGVGMVMLQGILQSLPKEHEPTVPLAKTLKSIFVVSAPLFIATVMMAVRVQADILILGALGSKEDVALYGSALRLVSLVVTPLLIMNAVLPPIIVELYAQKKLGQLEHLLRTVATLLGLPSLVILIALSFMGAPILGLLYGDFYRQGTGVLVILSIGQLLNVLAGSCSLVLSMTGHQNMNMIVTSISAAVAVIAGIILTKTYGMTGMAISSALALSLQNILMVTIAKQKLGIWTQIYFSLGIVQSIGTLLRRGV